LAQSEDAAASAQDAEVRTAMERLTGGDPTILDPVVLAIQRYGFSPSAAMDAWKETRGLQSAIIDDAGAVSYRELVPRLRAIAAGLDRRGHGYRASIGLLCRNSRHFVEGLCGALQAGCDVVLLNTSFAGPQLLEVVEREGIGGLICDPDFIAGLDLGALPCYTTGDGGYTTGEGLGSFERLDAIAYEAVGAWTPPPQAGRTIILTSGTTGTPKGAQRGTLDAVDRAANSLEQLDILIRLGFRVGQRVLVAPPLFHAWGLKLLLSTLSLGGTLITHARFDPTTILSSIERFEVSVLGLVPVMLQRLLAIPDAERKRFSMESLESVVVSGSALPAALAHRWMDAFGDTLHNLYGSTEVGVVSVASPHDLRTAPGTAGRAPRQVSVRVLDAQARAVPQGQSGRIFVRTSNLFDRYTGGGGKEVHEGHMATGDLGYLDSDGRLFVEGRSDDMVISGGENVFPLEIENLLFGHPDVAEAAVVGVPDEEFGHRLRAYVVQLPDGSLDESAVKEYVRTHLARFKVPREVVFLEELPRNPAGKVLKRLLTYPESD